MQMKYLRQAPAPLFEYVVEITRSHFGPGNVLWRQQKGRWERTHSKHPALFKLEPSLHFVCLRVGG